MSSQTLGLISLLFTLFISDEKILNKREILFNKKYRACFKFASQLHRGLDKNTDSWLHSRTTGSEP